MATVGPVTLDYEDSSSQSKAGDWDPLPGDKHVHGPVHLCLGSPGGAAPHL